LNSLNKEKKSLDALNVTIRKQRSSFPFLVSAPKGQAVPLLQLPPRVVAVLALLKAAALAAESGKNLKKCA